jgi:DNA-binding transcriptional LysR family regulator
VVLTKEGEILFEYASSAIGLINVGEKKIMEAKNLMAGELRIGVGDTISRYFLLPFLEDFHSKYPNIKLRIVNRTSLEFAKLLKSGEVDIAICNLPIENPQLEIKELMDIHDIFVCGEKYKDKIFTPLNLNLILDSMWKSIYYQKELRLSQKSN